MPILRSDSLFFPQYQGTPDVDGFDLDDPHHQDGALRPPDQRRTSDRSGFGASPRPSDGHAERLHVQFEDGFLFLPLGVILLAQTQDRPHRLHVEALSTLSDM